MTEITPKNGAMFRSLRSYNARLFFLGLLFSNVGSWLQLTATSFLLYRLTGDAVVLGINTALQFLPMLIFGAWAGALSDRFNRRRITLITQSLMALQAIVLGVCDLTGNINVPIVFALSTMLGLVGALDNPARRALVTELVPEADMSNAMSLNSAVMTGSRIFGPAIASALVGPLGTGWLFILNGISFATMLLGITGLRTAQMYSPAPRPAGGTPVRDGLRFVAQNERLRMLLVVFTVVSTFAFNYNVALPKLSDIEWGDPKYFGWVFAVISLGSFLGALLNARLVKATYRWVAANMMVLGVANIGMAWSPNVWIAFLWAIPLGIGGVSVITAVNAITQQESPPDMRGRLLALTGVAFLGSTPIGGPITGFIAELVTVQWSLAYGGITSLASGVYMMMWMWKKGVERG